MTGIRAFRRCEPRRRNVVTRRCWASEHRPTTISAERDHMATKERLAAMAASLCAVCSGSMVIKLVEADPSDGASELRTYVCAECGHRRTYSAPAGNN